MNLNKIIVEEIKSFLDEAAMKISDLPEDTALFIQKWDTGYEYTLYNPEMDKVFAYLATSQRDRFGDYPYVQAVAADKGYGPLIYELAMMHSYEMNTGLMPSRYGDITEKARRVWEKFYNRGDVNKTTLDLNDDNFRFDIIVGDEEIPKDERKEFWDESTDDEKRNLLIFNTVYNINPTPEYYRLRDKSKEFDRKIIRRAFDVGDELWRKAYDMVA